jgi:hypothetical protein
LRELQVVAATARWIPARAALGRNDGIHGIAAFSALARRGYALWIHLWIHFADGSNSR